MRRLYWIALNNHYILWTVSFGLGLFLGIKLLPYFQTPAFLYFFIIGAVILISLSGPVCILKKNTISDGNAPEAKNLLLIVVVPVIVMMLMGYFTGVNSKEVKGVDLSPAIDREEDGIMGVIIAKGRVSSHPAAKYGSIYLEMEAECFWHTAGSGENEGKYIGEGKIGVIIKRPGNLNIKRDDLIEVKGEAASSVDGSRIRANHSNIRFIRAGSFPERMYGFRKAVYNCISRTFYKYLDYRYAPVAEALILGDRTNVSNRLQDDFRQSGTAHLMAISGMHISFIVLIIYIFAARVKTNYILIIFIIIFLIMYNYLLGLKASVLRASIWMVSAAAAVQWNRQPDRPRILCISFILLLILSPSFSNDIGFWFSFSAMAGVVFIYPLFIKILSSVPLVKKIVAKQVFRTLTLTISIQLTCGPLILYYFGSLPLISPVSNILILPFFYILLLLLMMSAVCAVIWPPIGGIILKVTTPLFNIMGLLTGFFSRPGLPVIKASNIMPLQLFIYYTGMTMLLIMIHSLPGKKLGAK